MVPPARSPAGGTTGASVTAGAAVTTGAAEAAGATVPTVVVPAGLGTAGDCQHCCERERAATRKLPHVSTLVMVPNERKTNPESVNARLSTRSASRPDDVCSPR